MNATEGETPISAESISGLMLLGDVAKAMRVGKGRVRQLVREGALKAIVLGERQARFRPQDVHECMKRLETKLAPEPEPEGPRPRSEPDAVARARAVARSRWETGLEPAGTVQWAGGVRVGPGGTILGG